MTSATVTQLGEMIANISNNMGNMDSQNGEFAGIFQTAAEKSDGMEIQQAPTTKTSVMEKPMNISKKADDLKQPVQEEQTVESQDVESIMFKSKPNLNSFLISLFSVYIIFKTL